MKCSISSSSTLLLLLLLDVLLFLLPLIQSDDLISRTCKKTHYYDLCVFSLQSNPRSSNTDVKGLASIMANVTLSNATNTLNYTEELINHNTDTELEPRLTYCAEVYISLVHYILPQAIDALANGQFGFAKYGISEAGDEAQACEKKISGGSVKLNLTEMNRIMQNLCDVCVSIITILLKG